MKAVKNKEKIFAEQAEARKGRASNRLVRKAARTQKLEGGSTRVVE